MIRPLLKMCQTEQDNYYNIVMSKLSGTSAKKRELQELMATIYAKGSVSGHMVRKICPSHATKRNSIKELREAGASIVYQPDNYVLNGFENGEICAMVFKNTYAPHIKLSR